MKRLRFEAVENEEKRDEIAFCSYKENLPKETDGWEDAKVDGVTLNGEPLDGDYLNKLIEEITFLS